MGCSKSLDGQNYDGALILGDLPSSDYLLSSPSRLDSADSDLYKGGGTVLYIYVSPSTDAKTLRDAMSQTSTDGYAISKILGARTSGQMKKIAEKYYDLYNRSLKTDFEKNLHGKFEKMCIGRLHGRYEYDAYVLHNALTDDVDESAIIDVLCTKTNREINKIKEKYREMYSVNLIKDLKKVIKGDFQNLIVLLLKANREKGPANVEVLASDATDLRRGRTLTTAGMRLLTERSFDHLRALFEMYQKRYGLDVEKSIKRNVEGSLMSGMLTIVKFIKNPLIYYSSLLHGARNGGNDKSDVLIRCVLARCEIDMWDIKIKYHEIYNVILDDSILQNQSEDWMKLLKSLIRTPTEVHKLNASDILDTTFSMRRRVFKEMVGESCLKSEPILPLAERRLSAKTGYFAGTVRPSAGTVGPSGLEESKSTMLNTFTNLFPISLKQLPEEKAKSNTGSTSSLKNLDGRSKINIRRAVYGKASTVPEVKRYPAVEFKSSNHDHVDRKKQLCERAGRRGNENNIFKQKTMLDRDIKFNIAKPEDSSRVTAK